MNRSKALENVQAILKQRGESYGDLRKNWTQTSLMMSMIAGKDITPEQFGAMMIAMKLSRLANSDCKHVDSLLDIIGYAALTLEVIDNEH